MWWRKKTLRSSKMMRRKRRSSFFRFFLVISVFVLLVVGSAYLLKRPEVTIKNIILDGNKTVSTEILESFVKEKLLGNYLFIFPRSSIFIYPRRIIEENIPLKFKKIKTTKVTFNNFDSITVTVKERIPKALWCGENRLEGAIPECFFLDEKGFLYTQSPSFTGDVNFRFYGPLGEGSSIGQQFLPEKKFQEISFFLQSLQESDIQAVELAIGDERDYELYLENGTQVLFSQDEELSMVLDNLQSTLLSDTFKEHGEVRIDYIDLRFGNKVYYKFKDE